MMNLLRKFLSRFNVSSKGVCTICDLEFDDKELSLQDGLYLCPKDANYYKNHDWYFLAEAVSDPENPEAALELQNRKDELKMKNIKSYIKSEYFDREGQIITKFNLFREAE